MEGFICPVCKFIAADAQELTSHFALEHEGPDKNGDNQEVTKSVKHTSLSHQNMATVQTTAPPFRNNPTCRVCSIAFGYSRIRRNCRNCGWAVCSIHSRNQTALPHIGFRHMVRVCDVCFADITHDRLGVSPEQGLVMSGKLILGNVAVLVKLSHLSMSLFRLSEDGTEDAGKLVSNMHLSEIISIRKGPRKENFTIGDTEGTTLVLRCDGDASSWVGTILQTKNDLLDAVRQLDTATNLTPEVRMVVAFDPEACLGPFPVVISSQTQFRTPVLLPYLTACESSYVEIHLSAGTIRLDGLRLYAEATGSAKVAIGGGGGGGAGEETEGRGEQIASGESRQSSTKKRMAGVESISNVDADNDDGEADEGEEYEGGGADESLDRAARRGAKTFWVRVKRPPGISAMSKQLSVEMRVTLAVDHSSDTDSSGSSVSGSMATALDLDERNCSRSTVALQVLYFWGWLLNTPAFDVKDGTPLPVLARRLDLEVLLGGMPIPPALLQSMCELDAISWLTVLASLGAMVMAIGALRVIASRGYVARVLEGVLMTGLGAVLLAPWFVVVVIKGEHSRNYYYQQQQQQQQQENEQARLSSSRLAHRYRLILTDYMWDAETGRAAAAAAAPVVSDVGSLASAGGGGSTGNQQEGGGRGSSADAAIFDAANRAGLPERFVRMTRNDLDQAAFWWSKCLEWRAANQELLQLSRPHYDAVKQEISHYYHKRDRYGRLVYYEVLDHPRRAFRNLHQRGISVEDVVEHMTFVNEYTHQIMNSNYDEVGVPRDPKAQLVKIMDIKSLGLSDCGGDVRSYFNGVSVIGKNFPERIDRIIVINVPAAFGMVWNIVAPLLDSNVRERVSIFRGDYYSALEELIAPEDIPEEYGGQCRCDGGCRFNSPEEKKCRTYISAANRRPSRYLSGDRGPGKPS